MESDKNPFPKIDLFPRITAVSRFLLGLYVYPDLPERGAAAMLDKQLELELTYGPHEQEL